MEQILIRYFSLTTIQKLHTCRLCLQGTLLSDITTLKKDKLLITSLQGIRANQRTTIYAWPCQKRSNAHSWKLWKTIIRKIYCSPSSNFLKQSFRFRRWINCSTIYHHYLYSRLGKKGYQKLHSTIIKWFASTITRKSISILPSTNCTYTRIPSIPIQSNNSTLLPFT